MKKEYHTLINFFYKNKKGARKIGISMLSMLLLFTTYSGAFEQDSTQSTDEHAKNKSIIWDVGLNCNNPGGQNDYVVFGEAPDANDGPPVDAYDVLKPPAPQTPYIRAWFNDNLPYPYDLLTKDYRSYPDVSKVWNLTVHWMPSGGASPTTITVSWDLGEFTNCEYTTVTLCTEGGTPLQNMLDNSSYVFSCPAYIPQNFKIMCSSVVNQPPVANADSYSVNEDTPLTVAVPGILGNDYDPDGDPITAEKQSDPTHGSVTLNSNGSFTYIPTLNYYGSDFFTYKAYDGFLYSNLATVTITVNPINDAPVAYPDSYSTNEDVTLTIAAPGVLGNDVDVDGDTLTAVKVTDPSHGSVTLNNNGGFTYIPSSNYYGSDFFTYKAYDGLLFSNTATVTFTINPVNDAPVAYPDSYSTDEDVPLTIPPPGVLTNDVDIDGDPLTAVKVTDPSHGSVTLQSNGGFTYSPHAGFHGIDTFTYKAYDGLAYSNDATVTITVNAVNHPPVATDDSATVAMDSKQNKIDVLANDNDPDGDSLTIIHVSNANHGTTSTDGGFVYYTPAIAYSGSDSFYYTISDGHGGTDTASVSITVQANVPPNKPSTPQGTSEGKLNTPYTYSTSTTDSNGHQVYYFWDWGDGTQSEWLGPYNSGVTAETTHTWKVKTSSVKVKAKDIYGAESGWSDPLPITMPLSYQYRFHFFISFIQLFIRFLRGEFMDMRFIEIIQQEGLFR